MLTMLVHNTFQTLLTRDCLINIIFVLCTALCRRCIDLSLNCWASDTLDTIVDHQRRLEAKLLQNAQSWTEVWIVPLRRPATQVQALIFVGVHMEDEVVQNKTVQNKKTVVYIHVSVTRTNAKLVVLAE